MSNYSIDSIQALGDIEHIRLRSGMYVGAADDPRQLLSETLDNALDESMNGYANLVEVHVDTINKIYRVVDYGRGIPIGMKASAEGVEMEVLELLISTLNSGGKFDHEAFKISSGLHGVGMTCTNALSEIYEITTRRDGKAVYIANSCGKDKQIIYYDTAQPNGVEVSFKADGSIFESTEVPMDFIITRCRTAKAFGNNVELYVDGKAVELPFTKISDLLPEESNHRYAEFEISCQLDSGESLTSFIRYTSDTNSKFYGYTNLLFNRYGGNHVSWISDEIEKAWAEFFDESPIELKPADCKLGIRVLGAVFISETVFSNQTKDKLTVKSPELSELVGKFRIEFKKYLENNPEIRKGLLNRFSEYRMSQNRLTARKEIMELVKINGKSENGTVKRKSIVHGLVECTSPTIEGTELYIVEGNSAGGTVAKARNKRLQSVLPLRGKILNIAYKSLKEALNSEMIRKIVNATGAGVGDEVDPERCRYEKIIINADSDPDGGHIAALCLSVFVNFLPALVKAGRIYILYAPLFGYKQDGNYVFTSNFEDIPQKLKDTKGYTRYKGLGEMDDDEYREACMIPGKRNLFRVEYPNDIDAFNQILGTSHGKRELMINLGIIKYMNGRIDDEEEF